MPKTKTTKKAIKEMGYPIIAVGYCDLQHAFDLAGLEPFAYSTRAEGWACDYYFVAGVVISTGYAPIGKTVKNRKRMTAIDDLGRKGKDKPGWWHDGRIVMPAYRRLVAWAYKEVAKD